MFSQTSYCRNSKSGEWHYKVNPEWKPGVNLNWEEWCGPLGSDGMDPKVYYQWHRYRKTSTGVLGDLLVHVMTPMLMTLDQGWPVRVTGIGSHLCDKEMENHDLVNLAVEFETGHQMIACGGTRQRHRPRNHDPRPRSQPLPQQRPLRPPPRTHLQRRAR